MTASDPIMPSRPRSGLAAPLRLSHLWWGALGVCVALMLPTAPMASAQTPAVSAQAANGAKVAIGDAIERALKILRDDALKRDSKARIARLREAVDHVFDWDTMARSSMGHHWRKLDEPQRAEFVSVFKELLAKRYMDDIDRFQGSEQLRVTGAEVRGEQVVVKTVLTTVSREEVPIDYTMHRADNKAWVAEDVAIEGVSMVNHYRKTFGRFLVNRDFPELMGRLKRRLGVK